MSIQYQRSKFKKSTETYFKDNLLDIIDISETLSKNRYIHKCPLNNFIFSKYISDYNISKENINNNNDNNLEKDIKELNTENINFEKLNDNKFHINFMKLKLEYENDYTILFIDKYYPLEIIGAGSFGLVLSVIEIETNFKLAVKIIDKRNMNDKSEIDNIAYQVKLLKKMDNPRIMKIFNVLETKKYIFIFMELIEGGNLKDLIINRYIDPSTPFLIRDCECSMIMKGILESLLYLHKNNIIHRDIKPENILFKKQNDLSSVVLCDFGLAYQLKEYDMYINNICGTTIYMAPEIFSHRGYDYLVDSFSAGIVLFELCSGGMHPFFKNDMKKSEYIEKILKFNEKISFPNEMPLLARNLFLKLCKYDPILRYGPYRALRHPWITRSNQSQIPMTLLEEYNMSDKIVNFKALLSVGIALNILKKELNLKQKIHEIDSTFNETIFNISSVKKKSKRKISKINLQDNLLKSTEKLNYNYFNGIQSNIKPVIPLLRTSRAPKNLDKIIEEKLSKKRIFPKIEFEPTKKKRYKEMDENGSKVELKYNIDKNKNKNKKIKLHFFKNNNTYNKNRNEENPYLYLRTYSCNKNKSKRELNNITKNVSYFSIPKKRKPNKNNSKKKRLCDQRFQEYNITLHNKNNMIFDNYFLKDNKTNYIIKKNNNENRNKTPNLLSLNYKKTSNLLINNVNNKYNINLNNSKNIPILNKSEYKTKKNNKRFFIKDVLCNIMK